MLHTKESIAEKLCEYQAMSRVKRQLEFELTEFPASEDSRELELRLSGITTELRRLEFYIELLGKEYSDVLKALYFEGLTNKKAATTLFIDPKTLVKRKEHGLSLLADMYNLLSHVNRLSH